MLARTSRLTAPILILTAALAAPAAAQYPQQSGENQVIKNLTTSTQTYGGGAVHQPPGMLAELIRYDPNSAYTIVRFTAPNSGTFSITGGFSNLFDFGFADSVYVLKNSDNVNRLFVNVVNRLDEHGQTAAPTPFSFTAFLNSGNTLDFITRSSEPGIPGVGGLFSDITQSGSPFSWNAVNDFGSTNPSGVWSYGSSSSAGGTFNPLTVYRADCGANDGADGPGKLACFARPDAQTPVTTPEPSSVALLGTGLIGLVPMVRRRRNGA